MLYLLTGSNPLVGSSKYTTSLSPIKLIPKESFLLNPPERIPVLFSLSFTSPHFSRISSTSYSSLFLDTHLILPTKRRCSATVKES